MTENPMQPITPHPALEVKDIEISRPLHWLALAWKDMERCPTAGAAHGLILAIVAGAAATLKFQYWRLMRQV